MATTEHGALPPRSATAPLLLAGTWVVQSAAIARHNGSYSRPGVLAALLAWGLLLAAVFTRIEDRRLGEPLLVGRVERRTALVLVVGAGILGVVGADAAIYGQGVALDLANMVAVIGAVAALALLTRDEGLRAGAVLVVIAATVVAGAFVIRASPFPQIDVWNILQQGADALLRGDNPYTQCWTAHRDPATVCTFAYPPGAFGLSAAPRLLLGDVRYGLLLALVVGAVLIGLVAAGPRREGATWRRTLGTLGGAMAVAALLQPKWLFLVEQSWTEPFLLALLSGAVLAVLNDRPREAVLLFGVALATKQHIALLVPLAAAWPAMGVRRTAQAVGVAALMVVPWWLASPADFVDDTWTIHLALAPRPDSLSLNSVAMEAGHVFPTWLTALLTLGAMALALRLPRDVTGFTLGAAFVVQTFSLFNSQVFFNHHTFVLHLVLLALAAHLRPQPPPPTATATEPLTAELHDQ